MRFLTSCLAVIFLAALSSGLGQVPSSVPAADDPAKYLRVVQKSADALLENARDTYGPQHSGLILSLLNRKNGKPLDRLPEGPAGIRKSDRPVPYGSNASLQMEL